MEFKNNTTETIKDHGDVSKWDLYRQINEEIGELNKVLGFARNEDGIFLNRLAIHGDKVAKKEADQLFRACPSALDRQTRLTAMAIEVEDELGITEEYIRLLEDMEFPDEDLETPARGT